nr:hypothetical protein [Caldilineaceae bacterium]
IGTLIVVAVTGLYSPELRSLGALHEAKPVDKPADEPQRLPAHVTARGAGVTAETQAHAQPPQQLYGLASENAADD